MDTVFEAIVKHGGEATGAEANLELLSDSDQLAIVSFLKNLQMSSLPLEKNPPPQMTEVPDTR